VHRRATLSNLLGQRRTQLKRLRRAEEAARFYGDRLGNCCAVIPIARPLTRFQSRRIRTDFGFSATFVFRVVTVTLMSRERPSLGTSVASTASR
jgi:hypothetical protein